MSPVLTQIPGKQRWRRGRCPGEGRREAGEAGQRLSDLKSTPRGQRQGRPSRPHWFLVVRTRRAVGETVDSVPPTLQGAGERAPRGPGHRPAGAPWGAGPCDHHGCDTSEGGAQRPPVPAPQAAPRSGGLPAGGVRGRGPVVRPWLRDFTVSAGFFAIFGCAAGYDLSSLTEIEPSRPATTTPHPQ